MALIRGRAIGFKAAQRRLAQVSSSLSARATHALQMEANAVMREAKRQVPFDGGDLENSGVVDTPAREGINLRVRLSFGDTGGPADEYALAVHETPSPHDPPAWIGKTVTFHHPGTGPKYLEAPLNAAASGMDDRIAARLKV
jgi:hypothetical protein